MNSFANIDNLVQFGLLKSENLALRKEFSNGFLEFFKEFDSSKEAIELLNKVVQICIKEMIPLAQEDKFQIRCWQMFEFINYFFDRHNKNSIAKLDVNYYDLIKQLAHTIISRPIKEKSQAETDNLLYGIIYLEKVLIAKFPEYKEEVGQQIGLTQYVLKTCLFEYPKNKGKKNQVQPPKCKAYYSRSNAFKLLNTLSRDCLSNYNEVMQYLMPLHANATWRTKREADWNISPRANEKSMTGFVGLKNLGCICYMNSLMQQFFMIPSFRQDILAVNDPNKNSTPKDDNVLYQIQCIFTALQTSEKQYYNPKGFCHAFKDWDGNPTNVLE